MRCKFSIFLCVMKIFNTFTQYFRLIFMNIREIEYSRHFLVIAHGDYFPKNAFTAGKIFAKGFQKGLTLLVWESKMSDEFKAELEEERKSLGDTQFIVESVDGGFQDIVDMTERTETPMIFVEFSKKRGFYRPMNFFKGFRELRIPFVMMKDTMTKPNFDKILVPVAFLPEEKEKGSYSSNMGRFLGSEIQILQAKDYGTRAKKNVDAITKVYDGFELKYSVEMGKKDSFKVEKEAVEMASSGEYGMVLITNSRDYGLDDIIFGPKEQHLFKQTTTPLMCINPRGDLYVLCW